MKSLLLISTLQLFLLSVTAQPNVRPDRKIGKKELEISVIPGYGDRGVMTGGQIIYRFPLSCGFKIGAGFHITTDENRNGTHPGLLADLTKFIGNKQKWIFDGQVGKAFFTESYSYFGINGASYHTTLTSEVCYKVSVGYRMNAGRNITFFAGPFFLLQTFEANTEIKDGIGQPLNPIQTRTKDGSGGIRIGLVF